MTVLETRNLLVNGNAEAGMIAQDFSTSDPPTGWTTTGGFTEVAYSIGSSDDINSASSADIDGGAGYFAGGPGSAAATATQFINVSSYADLIDAGKLKADANGFFGGFDSQANSMTMVVTFLSADHKTALGHFTIGGFTNNDRDNVSEMLFAEKLAAVPEGTRFLKVDLEANRNSGTYNDGYADNVSVTLVGAGLKTGSVRVTATHDFTSDSVAHTGGITFDTIGVEATATFAASEFAANKIDPHALIVGDINSNVLQINLGSDHTFDASGFTFQYWTAGDRITITGSSSADTITGSAKADSIVGGGGADKMNGGAGHDTFVYNAVSDSTSTNHDTITGFDATSDKIDIKGLGVTFSGMNMAVDSGQLRTAHFDADLTKAVGAQVLHAHHAVLYTAKTGDLAGHTFLVVDANGQAGYQAGHDLVIELTGATHLSSFGSGDILH